MPEPGSAEKQPDVNARRLAGLREALRVLGDSTATLKIGPDDSVTTTYAAMKDNLQAQTQATKQAGMPSYGGINAENVMQLMKQRSLQDQQFRQQPMDMSQMAYQNALAGQARVQPQMKMADMAMRFMQGAEAQDTALGVAGINANSRQAVASAKAQSALTLKKLEIEGRLPAAAIQEANAIAQQVKATGGSDEEALTARMNSLQGNPTVEQILGKAIVSAAGGTAGLGGMVPEIAAQVKDQYVKPQKVTRAMPRPNPNIAKAPPMDQLRAEGEASSIRTTGKMPAKYWKIDAEVPGLGRVTNVFGSWAEIDLGNGETLVVTKGK